MEPKVIVTAAIKDEFDNYFLLMDDRYIFDILWRNNPKFKELISKLLDTDGTLLGEIVKDNRKWYINPTAGKIRGLVKEAKTKGMIMGDEDITMILVTPREAYKDEELYVFGGCMARCKFRVDEFEPRMITSFVDIQDIDFNIHQITIANPFGLEDSQILSELREFTKKKNL